MAHLRCYASASRDEQTNGGVEVAALPAAGQPACFRCQEQEDPSRFTRVEGDTVKLELRVHAGSQDMRILLSLPNLPSSLFSQQTSTDGGRQETTEGERLRDVSTLKKKKE